MSARTVCVCLASMLLTCSGSGDGEPAATEPAVTETEAAKPAPTEAEPTKAEPTNDCERELADADVARAREYRR